MATRNIVPRSNGEGQIGTAAKKWNKIYTDILYVGEDSIEVAIGRPIFDVILRPGYIKANGASVTNASTAIPRLLAFVQANPSLLAADAAGYAANKLLYLYDSGTDALTLPDYVDLVPQGAATVGEIKAGLPNITGTARFSLGEMTALRGNGSGAIAGAAEESTLERLNTTAIYYTKAVGITFDASRSSALYGASNTVQPPAAGLIPQIKY